MGDKGALKASSASGRCTVETGARFCITTEELIGDGSRASTVYQKFAADVGPGDRVLLNDGAVILRAICSDGVSVTFDVVSGGPIGDNKGINLPGVKVSSRSMTPKDLIDMRAGLKAGIDFVALSFVRSAADVQTARERMGTTRVPIIAKIERPASTSRMASWWRGEISASKCRSKWCHRFKND